MQSDPYSHFSFLEFK